MFGGVGVCIVGIKYDAESECSERGGRGGRGVPEGIDAVVGGSRYLIEEWEHPPIGVVFAVCPSGGHDTVMLDYTQAGSGGEPTVAYVDEDRAPRTIAASFEDFVTRLRWPRSGTY